MSEHTTAPWRADVDDARKLDAGECAAVNDSGGTPVCTMCGWSSTEVEIANAEHIVRCVNAHEALVAAGQSLCEEIRGLMKNSYGLCGYHLNGDDAAWGEFELDDVIAQLEAAITASNATSDNEETNDEQDG